ncbi:MAG: DUF2064 domain-containing protein [Acidobacteriota bacterium]
MKTDSKLHFPDASAASATGLAAIAPRSRAVVVLARSPRAEARAKGLKGAEALFALGRDRALEAASAVHGAQLVIVGSPGPQAPPTPSALRLPQRGRSFRERLENALLDTHRLGFETVVVVGLDAPGLTAGDLDDAFTTLKRQKVVLGPAQDGGVYLLGLRGSPDTWRPWIRSVRWQTRHVQEDWQRLVPEATRLRRELVDVDAAADLQQVSASAPQDVVLKWVLAALRRPAPQPLPRSSATVFLSFLSASSLSRRGPPLAA